MDYTTAVVLPVMLVVAGALADLFLIRVILLDWRERSRRRAKRRTQRKPNAPAPGRESQRRYTHSRGVCAAVTLVGSSVAVRAQPGVLPTSDDPARTPPTETDSLTIATDRPSFSDTAGIAPVGRLQLETGYTFTFRDRDGAESQRHNGPEALARFGLLDDRFELRFSTAGYAWVRTNSGAGFESSDGWNDLSLGFKLKLTDQDGALPRLALGAATTTGVGSGGISSRRAEPTAKLIWSYDLEKLGGESLKGFGVYGNVNASWTTTDGERFWQGAASICGTWAITDRWGVYAEYFSVFPASKGSGASHSLGFGTTYLLAPRVQFDARVGFGLNKKADNLFAGVGISILF